ncbi:MAG: LysM domain-containing protein, partial [Bacteroidota bacterium]
VPSSYNSTGGRLAPNNFNTDNTTNTVPNQVAISPGNAGIAVRNTGGLPAYNSPTVPRNNMTSRGASTNVNNNAVLPSSYNNTPTNRSMTSLESSNNRAIGSGNIDFGEPINSPAVQQPNAYNTYQSRLSTSNTTTPAPQPSSYNTYPATTQSNRSGISPYPTPNTPISYDQVARQPDSYYNGGSNQRRVHIVSGGESLYGIAKRYGMTVDTLRKINNLGPNDPIIEYQSIYLE